MKVLYVFVVIIALLCLFGVSWVGWLCVFGPIAVLIFGVLLGALE